MIYDYNEKDAVMIRCIPSTESEIKVPVGWREKKLSPAGPENGILHWRSEPPVSKGEIEMLESYLGKLVEPYPLETLVE